MRSLSKAVVAIIVALLGLIVLAPAAGAVETASSDLVVIREDVTIDDDLYATGLRIVIQGTINGDLIAFAGEEVVVEGVVTGSVVTAAQRVSITGEVEGSVRATAGSIEVDGTVGGDVVGLGASVELGAESTVGGDVLLWAFRADMSGSIGRDLTGTYRDLEVAGSVGRNIDVTVSRLSVTGPLEVGGDLDYRSPHEATGLDQVEAGGVVVQKTPLPPNVRVRALGLMTRLLVIVGLIASAVLIAMGWPDTVARGARRIAEKPFRSFGIGFLIFASPIVVLAGGAVAVALTPGEVSLPLLIVVIPVALAIAGIVLVLSIVASAPVAMWLGRLVRRSLGPYGAILLGGVIAGLIWLLPWVGILVPLLLLPLGIGGLVAGMRREPAPEPA